MFEYTVQNIHWIVSKPQRKCQLGVQDGVLGTVDQLLLDNCIMEEVEEHKRSLAVSYYDYKKAYEKMYHDWMMMVFRGMMIDERVWSNRKNDRFVEDEFYMKNEEGERVVSRQIRILRGFLQGDRFSPVGYCLTEVPIGILEMIHQDTKWGNLVIKYV